MLNLFKRNKETFEDLEVYDDLEEIEDIESIEEPIIYKEIKDEDTKEDLQNYSLEEDDLSDESLDDFNYDEEPLNYELSNKNRKNKAKLIINIIFFSVIIILSMISIDVISVSRYNKGPFFAIKTKTYKDGGTKEYYGFGYKVIKYNQIQGRRDIELGTYSLKYNATPIDIKDIDLAIEFLESSEETSLKYYKKFLRLSSEIKSINQKENQLVLEYPDEDKKYTFTIYCSMADKNSNIEIFSKKDQVQVLGTVEKFALKDKKNSNRVYLSNCFAETIDQKDIVEID